MKKLLNSLIVVIALISSSVFAAEIGKDYKLVNPPQPTSSKKIEVLEFFFYGCSHCYHLHGPLTTWEKNIPKDVELTYVPTIFRDSWEPMARTFYALQAMGQLGKVHDELFKAWNVSNLVLSEEGQITDFVAARGIDRAKFAASYNSFSMQSQVTRSKQMLRSFGISGTPTVIVDGKYLITGLQPDDTIRVMNEVIAMVRKTRPAAPVEKSKSKPKI